MEYYIGFQQNMKSESVLIDYLTIEKDEMIVYNKINFEEDGEGFGFE